MLYTLRFFSLQNAVCFIMLTCLVPVLFTFNTQGELKLKENNSGAKELINIQGMNIKIKYFNSLNFNLIVIIYVSSLPNILTYKLRP